ncbi:hypothetical protein FOA43_004288 [Brettanomyces nanus]|uniref:Uncharacterized protein n=1 Tax=Eeniella nana TaxID=13502 RepID=A0A875SDZ5_EENNA|nr:uncharacterized protein FOA43_004288 [Brettanomyces nanus]QPG76894.1 hypothetical protein FOA43_004288 [Brettanomyces nanus]
MTILESQLVGKDPTLVKFDEITGEDRYRRYGFLIIIDYIVMLAIIVLKLCFLGSDIYTLIQIYALENWDNYHAISYVPILVYKIVFTVCIGISMIFLIISIITGYRIYQKNYVIPSYLDDVARRFNSLRCYERFCIYENISTKSLADYTALTIYQLLHYDIFLWIFADTPRQVLNGATVAYSISNSFTSSNLVGIIKEIAATNEREAILLSFMTFSFIVWLFFSIKYVILIFSSMCVVPSIRRRTKLTFMRGCRSIVAESVMEMYEKEEKKKRRSMMRKRRFPSIIKDNSVAELTVLEESNSNSIGSLIHEKNPFDVEDYSDPMSSYRPPAYYLQSFSAANNSSETFNSDSSQSVQVVQQSVIAPNSQTRLTTNDARQRAQISPSMPIQQPQVARTTTDMTIETEPFRFQNTQRQHQNNHHHHHYHQRREPPGAPQDSYFPPQPRRLAEANREGDLYGYKGLKNAYTSDF